MKLFLVAALVLCCLRAGSAWSSDDLSISQQGTSFDSVSGEQVRQLLELPSQDISVNGACQTEIQDYCGYLLKAPSPKRKNAGTTGAAKSKSTAATDSRAAGEQGNSDPHLGAPHPLVHATLQLRPATETAQDTQTGTPAAGPQKQGQKAASNSSANGTTLQDVGREGLADHVALAVQQAAEVQKAAQEIGVVEEGEDRDNDAELDKDNGAVDKQEGSNSLSPSPAGAPGQASDTKSSSKISVGVDKAAAASRRLLSITEEVSEYQYNSRSLDAYLGLMGRYHGKRPSGHSAVVAASRQSSREVLPDPKRMLLWNPKHMNSGSGHNVGGEKKVKRISGGGLEVLQALGVGGAHEGKPLPADAPVARCLRRVVRLGQMSISPDSPQVSEACIKDLRDFLTARAMEVPLQIPLWVACAHDLKQRCRVLLNPNTTSALLLGCLKDHKAALKEACMEAVTQHQIESAEDISLDPELHAGCSNDRERLCAEVEWGGGAAKMCLQRYMLRKEPPHLSPPCQNALFKRMMHDSENIRFDYHLASACAADKQALCTDVSPGDGAAFECLLAEKDGMDITEKCRSAIDEASLWRALDVRLHWRFRQVCSQEVKRLCSQEELIMLYDPFGPMGKAAPVFECMRQQMRNLTDMQCSQLVHKILVAGFTDNRLDTLFQKACAEEAAILCKGSPNQVVCLVERTQDGEALSAPCRALVTNRLQQAASDIDFNPQLKEKCLLERSKFCDYADITGGAVIDCLVDSRLNPGFGAMCRKAVGEYLVATMSDIRMLHTLREACAEDLRVLCQGVEPGQGKLLMCLQRKRGQIQSAGCKIQLLRVVGLQADDHRLHHQLSKACQKDMQQFCPKVPPGGGLMHKCLRQHESKLSTECRQHEEELEQVEHEDARINPQIYRSCGVAVTLFCRDVQPGDARVLTCLRGNMDKPDFPPSCKKVLKEQLQRATVKFKLNKELREACEEDVEDECPDHVDDQQRMTCLAGKIGIVSHTCRSQLLALVKLQLSSYRMGMPLTAACDGDVLSKCQIEKLNMPLLAHGYVLSCLVKHATELHRPCWEVISGFDDSDKQHAKQLEQRHWNQQLPQGQLDKVVAEVRSSIEPHLTSHMMQHVSGIVKQEQATLQPKLRAILTAVVVLGVGTSTLMYLLFKWRNWRGPVVMKDGRL